MARNLTANFITQATSGSCEPIMFYEGGFNGSTLRLWNGIGDLSWNGQTWLGNGWYHGIDDAQEQSALEAPHMSVTLSGISGSVLSLILGSQVQGATGKVWLGFLSSGAVVSDPFLWWQGKYDYSEITEGPDETTVALHYENDFVDMAKPREWRFTNTAQQYWYSGDKGFEFMVAASNWNGQWGGEKGSGPNKKKNQKPKGKR